MPSLREEVVPQKGDFRKRTKKARPLINGGLRFAVFGMIAVGILLRAIFEEKGRKSHPDVRSLKNPAKQLYFIKNHGFLSRHNGWYTPLSFAAFYILIEKANFMGF